MYYPIIKYIEIIVEEDLSNSSNVNPVSTKSYIFSKLTGFFLLVF